MKPIDEGRDPQATAGVLFFANPIPMWVYDSGTLQFIEVNDAAVTRYGYSRNEFLAMTIADIRPPEDISRLIDVVERREKWQNSGMWRHRLRSGAVIHVEITSHRLTFRGRPATLVAAYDVTERVRAEEAAHRAEAQMNEAQHLLRATNTRLKRSKRRYRNLVENMSEVVWALDRRGVLRYVSHAVEQYGFAVKDLVGKPFSTFVHPDDADTVQAAFTSALEGQMTEVSYRAFDKTGMLRFVRTSCRQQMKGGRVVGLTGVLMDITQQRRTEEQLRVAQRLEAVGRLAGGVAHDFNNLLVAINGYAELALREIPENDQLHADVSEILKAGRRAAALTGQLLAFSRKQVLRPDVVNLNGVVRSIEPMLRRLIGEHIDFRTWLAPDLRHVRVDASQMEQVITNLVVNARDAMPMGGTLRITTSNGGFPEEDLPPALAGTDLVVIAISDSGHGMDEATRAQIFEPFFSTKAVGEGTGLGLPMVYGVVQQSGGAISVRSEPGVNTTFTIGLPVERDAEGGDPARAPVMEPGKETILVVEDERAARDLVSRMLSKAGYHILSASNAAEALGICRTYPARIDLLLTDVVMPHMSGVALAVRASALRSNMRILYMSGYTGNEIAAHGLDAGTYDIVTKPFTLAGLTTAVRVALDSQTDAAPLRQQGRL